MNRPNWLDDWLSGNSIVDERPDVIKLSLIKYIKDLELKVRKQEAVIEWMEARLFDIDWPEFYVRWPEFSKESRSDLDFYVEEERKRLHAAETHNWELIEWTKTSSGCYNDTYACWRCGTIVVEITDKPSTWLCNRPNDCLKRQGKK